MTSPKDFDKVIKERLKSLNKPTPPEEPVNTSESVPDLDEGVDKDKADKRAKKRNEKHMRGYVNRKRKQ